MNSSILVLALAGLTSGQTVDAPAWQTDYAHARTEGESQKKPLAVFLGSGDRGWEKVARDGGLGSQAQKLLREKFVPVYIDTSSDSGKQLAVAFSLTDGQGLVVSDRSGEYVAFRQVGDLTNTELVRQLERSSSTRTSFYSPTSLSSTLAGSATSSVTSTADCPTCGGMTTVSTGRRLFRR